MDIKRDHVVHSRGGKLGAAGTSGRADMVRILTQAHAANPPRGLALHFHGGLVNAKAGTETAERLAPSYAQAGTYPICFVWESGPFETLRNNLRDILADSVFQELVKKVAEWTMKELGDGVTTRGRGGAPVDEVQLRTDFDRWFANQAEAPPVRLDSPPAREITTKSVAPDEDDLATRIEGDLDNDERFQQVMAGLYVASGRGAGATTKGGSPPAADVDVLVDDKAVTEMFPPETRGATRGILSWWDVAKFVAKVVIAVIRRHWNNRDHGAYTTIVEEVLRAAYLDRVGEVVWRMMKKDTADAFGDDPDCVGTAFLDGLAKLASEGKTFSQITLIGHSTGAVYITELLKKATAALPEAKFNVIFLAPANRFEDFGEIVAKEGSCVANFRMFTMTDELESKDQLLSIIYPRSLLYLISGVLEGEADVPIMGMQRFKSLEDTFKKPGFAVVEDMRTWFTGKDGRTVWSVSSIGDGLNCESHHHGDFDNDERTIDSIKHLLQKGF